MKLPKVLIKRELKNSFPFSVSIGSGSLQFAVCDKKNLSILHKEERMGSLTISNKILDKYFGYLKNLDINTKKNLITKLTKSMETTPKKAFDIKSIFGKWEDDRTSDEIISEIKSSRVEKRNVANLE